MLIFTMYSFINKLYAGGTIILHQCCAKKLITPGNVHRTPKLCDSTVRARAYKTK